MLRSSTVSAEVVLDCALDAGLPVYRHFSTTILAGLAACSRKEMELLVYVDILLRAAVTKLCSADHKGSREQFPRDPSIHFCNGYFEVWHCFEIKGKKDFVATILIGGVFIWYDII